MRQKKSLGRGGGPTLQSEVRDGFNAGDFHQDLFFLPRALLKLLFLQPQLATSSSAASLVRIPTLKPRRPHHSTTLLSLYAVLAPCACSYLYMILWDICLHPRALSAR